MRVREVFLVTAQSSKTETLMDRLQINNMRKGLPERHYRIKYICVSSTAVSRHSLPLSHTSSVTTHFRAAKGLAGVCRYLTAKSFRTLLGV